MSAALYAPRVFLPLARIARKCPELSGYDPAELRLLVEAIARQWPARGFRLLRAWAIGLIFVLAALYGEFLLLVQIRPQSVLVSLWGGTLVVVVYGLAWAAGVLLGFWMGILVRNRILVSRVRRVAAGAARWPTDEEFERTRGRLDRVVSRMALRVAAGLLVAPGVVVGVGQLALQHQALRAASDRPSLVQLREACERDQPPGVLPSDPDARLDFEAAHAIIERIDQDAWKRAVERGMAPADSAPCFPLVADSSEVCTSDVPELVASFEASRALAERLLGEYRRAGAFTALAPIKDHHRVAAPDSLVHPRQSPTPGDLSAEMLSLARPELTAMRECARINAARMRLAVVAREWPEALDAVESTLALARVGRQGPLLIDRLVAHAVESVALEDLRRTLAMDLPDDYLAGLQAAIERQAYDPGLGHGIAGERIVVLQVLCALFAEPRAVAGLGALHGVGSVGSFERNRDALNLVMGQWTERARRGDFWAGASPGAVDPSAEFPVLQQFLPRVDRCFRAEAYRQLSQRGLATLLALERFRAQRGHYPKELSELVPAFIKELPLDPSSDRPFGYRLLAAGEDGEGRLFYLYSVGADGQDNHGRHPVARDHEWEAVSESPQYGIKATGGDGDGLDFVINRPTLQP